VFEAASDGGYCWSSISILNGDSTHFNALGHKLFSDCIIALFALQKQAVHLGSSQEPQLPALDAIPLLSPLAEMKQRMNVFLHSVIGGGVTSRTNKCQALCHINERHPEQCTIEMRESIGASCMHALLNTPHWDTFASDHSRSWSKNFYRRADAKWKAAPGPVSESMFSELIAMKMTKQLQYDWKALAKYPPYACKNESWTTIAKQHLALNSSTNAQHSKFWAVLPNEGPKAGKPGVVYVHTTSAEQATTSSSLSMWVEFLPRPGFTRFAVALGFLKSYDDMGKFRVHLLGCDGSEYTSTHDSLWAEHLSVEVEEQVAVVTQSELLVAVTPLPDPGRKQNKIKLLSLTVTGFD
jgi:hypothetical protein